MSLPFGPPKPVSPIIRGLRWGFLVAGIFYARTKQSIYESMEADWVVQEAKRKVIRDKETAILKAKIAVEEKENIRLLETGKLFEEPSTLNEPVCEAKKK